MQGDIEEGKNAGQYNRQRDTEHRGYDGGHHQQLAEIGAQAIARLAC